MKPVLSLAHLTAIDLAPPDLIEAAARSGFDAVGLRLIRVTETSPGYPLMRDPAMMRATKAAIRSTGLRVHDIEFVKIEPDTDVASLDPFLNAGAELGASEVIAAPYDPDLSRLADRLAAFSERAGAHGLRISLEFFPWTVVPDFDAALALVQASGPDVGILVDSLHFDRSRSSLDSLRAKAGGRVRFAQICDAPVQPSYTTEELLHAARAERLPPGEGMIDLAAQIAALPPGIPIGLEVPMAGLAARSGEEAVIRRVMAAAQDLFRKPGSADGPAKTIGE